MSCEHTPSVDLALSLATPVPLARDAELPTPKAPSALPEPASSELHDFRDEHLGPVTELSQCFSVGEGVWLEVHWLLDGEAPDGVPKHLRQLELVVDGKRLPLRRGQVDGLVGAIGMAEYLFETPEREELARRTC